MRGDSNAFNTHHRDRLVRILLLVRSPIDQSMQYLMAVSVDDCHFDLIEHCDFVCPLAAAAAAMNWSVHCPMT